MPSAEHIASASAAELGMNGFQVPAVPLAQPLLTSLRVQLEPSIAQHWISPAVVAASVVLRGLPYRASKSPLLFEEQPSTKSYELPGVQFFFLHGGEFRRRHLVKSRTNYGYTTMGNA